MEVILKQDIAKLGLKDDLIVVKNGYAINYLIPKGLVVQATPNAKVVLAENKKQQAHKEQKIREEAQQTSEKLNGLKLTIGAKTSTTGKIFGSITTIQIAEELQKKGFEIDKKKIEFSSVKEIGTYKAKINLYRDIKAEVEFEVVSE